MAWEALTKDTHGLPARFLKWLLVIILRLSAKIQQHVCMLKKYFSAATNRRLYPQNLTDPLQYDQPEHAKTDPG